MNAKIKAGALVLILLMIFTPSAFAQINWTKDASNPVMENFNTQTWDHLYYDPCVLVIDDTLRMWYRGRLSSSTPSNIGYGYSVDGGLNWITNTNPVITVGSPGDWNRFKRPKCVLLIGDTLKMWYSATDNNYDLKSAIGSAKRHINETVWTINNVPVLEKGSPGMWDDAGVYGSVVIFDTNANLYKMWYHGWDSSASTPDGEIGYATSLDGENWVKDTVNNPVIKVGSDGTFYDTWIFPGAVIFDSKDNLYKMWFTGWDGFSSSPSRYYWIFYATSADGINWDIQNNFEPVLTPGSNGSWDQDRVSCGSVVVHEGILKMFYAGSSSGKIGLATDDFIDGINDLEQLSEMDMIIYPNPVNNIVTFTFHLSSISNTSIVIYNQQGQVVSTVIDEKRQTGDHEIIFDSKGLPIGVYFCVLKSNDKILTRKFIKM